MSLDKPQELQQTDPALNNVCKLAETEMVMRNRNVRFVVREGLLYRQWKLLDGGEEDIVDQLVLPVQCHCLVLEVAHNIPMARHLGKKKALDTIQQWFYWSSMFHSLFEYCKSCNACHKSAGKKLATKAKMIPLPIINVPFKRIVMDIVRPLGRSESGCRLIPVQCSR